MGSKNSSPPQAIPGFESFPGMMKKALENAMNYRPPLGLTPTAQFGAGELAGLEQIGNFLPQLFGGAQQGIGALTNNLTPEFLSQISAMLRPGVVNQPFQQGSADLREQFNLTTGVSGSGVNTELTNLLSGLERNLGQIAVPAALQAQGQSNQAGASLLSGLGMLPQLMQLLAGPRMSAEGGIDRGISQSQFGIQLPLLGAQGLSAGSPMYQPHSSSKLGSFIQAAAPIAGAFIGGPAGMAAGSAIGQYAGGAGGGGGGAWGATFP